MTECGDDEYVFTRAKLEADTQCEPITQCRDDEYQCVPQDAWRVYRMHGWAL